MKSKIKLTSVLLFLAVIFMWSDTFAQDCKFFYPTDVGVSLEYTFYNRKGKEDSKQIQKVIEKKQEDGATVVVIESLHTGKKKDEVVKTTFEVKCDNGNFYMNMDDFTSAMNYEQYQSQPNMEVKIDSEDLFYPSDLSVGQTLPDGKVQIDIAANGIDMFGTTITIKNRKVEAAETITTTAGTFECLKITADVVTKSFSTMKTKTIQWLAEGIGVVKSENQKSDGKLVSYQLLTKIDR